MPLRIADIIGMPELRTRAVGGEQGLERLVRWAHVCELPDPTEWLGDGDLLMTTGIGVPSDPDAQVRYIEALSEASLAGMMIGEDMQAPANLDALKETATRLGFPLLLTHYGVPFSSVTRAVIDAARVEEFERRNAIARVCVSARMAIEGLDLEALLQRLGKDVRAELSLWDPQTHELWLPKQTELSEKLREFLIQQKPDATNTQPVVRRHGMEDGETLAIAIPSRRQCVLLARRNGHDYVDYSLLNYMAAVLGIALERLHVECERALRAGAELMDELFQLRLSRHQASKRVEQFGLLLDTAYILVVRRGPSQFVELASLFERMDTPVLPYPLGDELVLMTQGRSVSDVQVLLETKIGISNQVVNCERLHDALREARLALAHANATKGAVFYAEIADRLPWLPQNLNEATQAFRQILGSVADHDIESRASLLFTLKIFLEQNRSWQNTAEKLHIHKTSLVYRIRRIEALTGRSLNNTADVSAMWLALQAAEILGHPLLKS